MQIINIKKYLWQILKLPQIPEFDPEHYGFTHQFDKEIKTIGYATNLNEETVDQAIKDKVDFGITPEPRPDNIKGYYCKLVGKINQPTSLEKLSNEISQILEVETQSWQFNPDNTNKICFASGGGAMTNDLKDAKEAGCDTYITGEVNMYTCEL
ncbi:Nif3-like dinuclear metal center hexameric protein, partial [Patescibacteria group bacterium]|nr:Nif3-like dinuclear metal center hexameric protein [Patescibacteria group bacterium]